MLNVSYLKTYGYMMIKGYPSGKYLKCKIHPTNALFATIYHHKEVDENGKITHYAELANFACDYGHLRRCLKNKVAYEDTKVIVIYTNTDWNDKWKVAQTFQKYGYNVQMKPCKRWTKKPRKHK